jgi:hypothetical protein
MLASSDAFLGIMKTILLTFSLFTIHTVFHFKSLLSFISMLAINIKSNFRK